MKGEGLGVISSLHVALKETVEILLFLRAPE